jgi:hypothetical protein
MLIRTALVLMLAVGSSLFALAPAAEAAAPKGPMWVTVTADYTITSRSHSEITTRLPSIGGRPKGTFEIFFARDITGCAATATTSDGWAGVTGVAMGTRDEATVTVYTLSALDGQLVDLPFHLIVMCPKK